MKKSTIVAAMLVGLMAGVKAQGTGGSNITVNTAVGQNVENFIKNNLVGDGVYIYNAKFNGQPGSIPNKWNQIGSFDANGYAPLGMENGVIMTTGKVNVAEGPNNNSAASGAVAEALRYSDTQLNSLLPSGQTVTSCSTLDFDFVCLSNSVSFTYCFGSEEYREYVFSNYNDVFAFYLTGIDPETGDTVTRNIAIVPNTIDEEHPEGIPVAINTVNNGTSGGYSSGCEGCYQFDGYYYDNDNQSETNYGVQYDGLTSKMSATAAVEPCVSYHMHISVCNVNDQGYDSGVFLEGNSFSTPSAAIGLSQWLADTIYRGTPKNIPLTLGNTDYDEGDLYVFFGGEAVSGIDYLCMTDDGVVLNNGESMALSNATRTLTITPLPGADLSQPKTLTLLFQTALCTAYPDLRTNDTMQFVLKKGNNEGVQPNGIEEAEMESLMMYPNPASGRLNISSRTAVRNVVVIDAAGREVIEENNADGATTLTIDISKLEAGIYTVKVGTDAGQEVRHVLVK